MNIQTVSNVSDCEPLYLPHSLYLKPHARLVISVQLPTTVAGKSISNWDVMENLRNIIKPDKFSVLKVTKSTLELSRLDAELDDRERIKSVLSKLDGNTIKMSGFSEVARIRASEAKDNFPKRHDWDSYFRDARNMDEKKPGERPDTIHISNLPIRWFCPRHMENEEVVKPSESIFKRIFEKFGSVRVVDIPICDIYRKDMKSHMTGMKTFSFDQELYFEGYVQFSEYIGFVRAMDALRGMKLLRKEGDKNLAINISVDFDTTKHLNESNIKRRQVIRDRLIMKENEKREEERRKAEEEEQKKEKERQTLEQKKIEEYEKQRMREEKRKEKQLKKIREQEQNQLSSKIRSEEKKLLIAQRKLESIRILEALFDRIKLKNDTIKAKIKLERDGSGSRDRHTSSSSRNTKSFDLRNKLISKVKSVSEQELERQKSRLKKYKSGIMLNRGSKERSPSVNSISSDESILSDKQSSKNKKRRKNDESGGSHHDDEIDEKHGPMVPGMGAYPMYHPETGQWMGMYPYPPAFFPPIYPPAGIPYSNNYDMGPRGGYRGRFPRSRGRRVYRGRINHYGNDDRRNDEWNDHKRRHRKRSGSRDSRSRSRSYSSRSRSRSYTRNRRNRKSRSRSRSRSKSRTKLQVEHKSRKLASTLRRSHSSSSSYESSRSRTPTRTRKRSRSSRSRHRSKESRDKKSSKQEKSVSNSDRKKRHSTQTPSPRKKSADRERAPAKRSPSPPRKQSKSRSKSIDSSAFQSPKRKAPSVTPEKEWD